MATLKKDLRVERPICDVCGKTMQINRERSATITFCCKRHDKTAYKTLNKDSGQEVLSLKKEVKTKEKPFVLSAWNDEGFMMDIDYYCNHYKLPREDVKKYKLVSHTGTPYYNIEFKENIFQEDIDYSFIDEIVSNNIKSVKVNPEIRYKPGFDRMIYTDCHIGMTPNKQGNSLYGGKWDAEELDKRKEELLEFVLSQRNSDVLVIDDLGDLVDGFNGKTARGGHDLPQNMTNAEMFKTALYFKESMIDCLSEYYSEIVCNNISEDNHSASFGEIINIAFKKIIEARYSHVKVTNHNKFINHYYIGKYCFVISHGKDSSNLKFGFKPQLDPKQIEKIDQYMKHNDIFKNADHIEFSKGDSHQMILDYTTSNDFDYFNFPAFSPPSNWIQTNYGDTKSGFVFQHVGDTKVIKPYFF